MVIHKYHGILLPFRSNYQSNVALKHRKKVLARNDGKLLSNLRMFLIS